jgi:hypothetical protein
MVVRNALGRQPMVVRYALGRQQLIIGAVLWLWWQGAL